MAIANSIILDDNSYGTLASGLAVSDVTLTFTSGHGGRFPAVAAGQVLYCVLTNANNVLEEIKVTAHTAAADTATIVRAANGSTAKAWAAGDRVEARLSSEALLHLQQEALKGITLTTGDSGATYTGTMTATHLGYVNKMVYCFLAATSNSGTTPTINIDGLGAKTVILDDGSALVASQMPVSGLYRYDDTNFRLLNPIEIATQAQMETGTATNLNVTPGRQHFHPGMPKAWGYITTTATGITSYPSSGVSATKNATADWTVTHGRTMSSANYAVVITLATGPSYQVFPCIQTQDATTFRFVGITHLGAADEPAFFNYAVFGDL